MTDHALLSADAHRELRIHTDRGAAHGDAVMACLTVPGEFRRVQEDYPILFRRSDDRGSITPVALFGLEAGENLFLDGDRWNARYVPLAMAIQPFLIGMAALDAETRQVHVDLDSPRIAHGGEGVRVFDGDGRPSLLLEGAIEKLGMLDAGYRATGDFLAALERHDLLEPLTFEVTLDDGSINRLLGFHVIDEDRLRALDAEALGELHREGHLMPIFMAIASIGNLAGLVARKNRRAADG